MIEEGDLPHQLRINAADTLAALLRASLGSIPVGGAVVAELVGRILPNLREQRLLEFTARLAKRLEEAEDQIDTLLARLDPERAALFEDGAAAALRSATFERIEQLARLVADGLTSRHDDEVADLRSFIRLLQEVNEAEVRHLLWFTKKYGGDAEWRAREDARRPKLKIPDQHHKALVVGEYARDGRLTALGLLRPVYRSYTQREDGTPLIERDDTELTSEGIALLRLLGLLDHDDERR